MANQWHFNKYQPNGTVNLDEHQTDLKPINGVVGNAIDAVSSIADTVKDKPFIVDTTGGDNKTLVADRLKAIADATGIDPSIAYNATFRTSALQFKYNNDELKANAALEYANKLNIGADVIMNSNEDGFRTAATLAAQVDRGKTVQEIYDEYPEMYKIKYNSQAEGIQAIQNLQSVKATRGIFDSIQQSVWAMNDQMKLGDVGFEMAHTADADRIKELNDEMERLQSNLQQYRKADALNPLQSIVGDTAAQAFMMGKQGGTGAIIGGAIGAVIGGLTTDGVGIGAGAATGAKWGGGADMAYEMYKMSFGNKYLELINKRDANGNKVYSNDEAYKYAMTYAAVDTGIEMASTRFMVKGIGKVAPKAVMSKVLRGATSDTLATFNRGIGTTVAQMAKASVKAGGSELVEEGLQDINEKFQHNLYRNDNDPEGVYSVGDMAVGAGGAMLQALPAVIGLGAIGGGISGIHIMKAFHEFQKLTPEEQQHAIMAEQNRNGTAIMQALKQDASSNKMAKENPELYGKIVQAQGDNVGVSTAYVNVNEMAETEEGQQAIKNMIDSGLVTQEEVSKSIEANADIPVPIGKYAQLSGGLTEETVKALEESTYFTRGGMSMKTLERAKAEVEAFNNNLVDATEKKAARVKESIIRDEFEDASDIDREVLDQVFSNPTQVKQAYNNLYKNLVQEYRENYASDFDNMDNDIKEATASGVEPQWLTDYKSNNGGKAPRTNAERRRAAFHSSVAKAQTAFADNVEALNQSNIHHADMEHTLQQIESLERLHDKIFTLANNDIALRMQLSKSGYEVYNKVVKAIGESTDRKQRETAKANALLMAQHADVMAQYMRQMGKGGYTAMDYLRDSVRINMNAVLDNQNRYTQSVTMQQKLEADIKAWQQIVDQQLAGVTLNNSVRLMDTPLVFTMLGYQSGSIYIDPSIIAKIIIGKHKNEIAIDDVKQLPKKIANPVAIFYNYDTKNKSVNKNEVVVVLDLYSTNNGSANTKGESIQAVLTFSKTNTGLNLTKVKTVTPRSSDSWYNKQIVNNLLYVNTKKINRVVTSNRQQIAQPITNRFISTNSISTEVDLDKLRKQQNYQYYQSAWHGSPHDFDTFDLGAIGTGEGNQAHGWGLYFAKDKKVSKLYKEVLSKEQGSNKSSLFKVEIPNETELLPEQYPISGYSRYVKDSLKNGLHKMTEEQLERFTSLLIKYHKGSIIGDEWTNKYTRFMDVGYIISELHNKNKTINDINKIQKRNVDRFLKTVGIEEDIDTIASSDELLKNVYEKFRNELYPKYEKEKQVEREREEKAISNVKTDVYGALEKTNIDGKQLYSFLSHALGNDEHFNLHNVKNAKKASEFLNSIGIKGIYYDGEQDGRCYVVFDDKAINVIEKYNQSVNGMTEIMKDGKRIISIFKTADRSTFLHEMGHVFFDDLQKLASMENAPEQLVTDWNKLKEWSGWVDGENVDNTKAHEKFARGWESYLRSGEAPTSALQRVFRQFSKWLTYIYRSVQRLGGEVPTDIKDVMARMIATQEDIEAYAEQQQLEQFEKTELYKQLSEQDQARMQSYIADVKEKAKERVMRKLMKELDNRPIKEWNEEKDVIQIEIEKRLIEQYPIYKEHQRYNVFGESALKDTQYKSVEELEKAEVEQTGATFNDAINQEMDNAKAEFMRDNNVGKTNEQIAEEILLSTQGQMKLTEEESKIIQQSTNRELAKNWALLERIRKLDANAETIDTELDEIEKEVKPTKYDELKSDKKKVDAALSDATKQLEKAEERIKRLQDMLNNRINNVRSIRGAGLGTISDYMERARKELGALPISNAVQFKTYQNKAVTAGKKADRALAVGDVDKALGFKREQMLQQARARVAFENFEKSKKLRLKLKNQLQRMTRPKNPIAIEPNMRYFYSHMAYQMGLTKYDGLQPTDGFDMNSVLAALDPDVGILNQQSTVQLEPWIVEMFYSKTPKPFRSITMNELETLEELMTGMYKNGRNEYEGTTILNDAGDSVSFENAVQEIIGEATETFGNAEGDVFNKLNNQTKMDAVSGKLYGFHLALLKVETFLRRMGGGKNGFAVKYIYDPINRATQAFNERKEVSMRRLAKDVGIYSKRELFDMRNDHLYTVGELHGLTKEQLIMIALNWGTESNRQRVMETTKANEVEIERAFQEHMTDKDWEFVIRTWDHINSFFDERSKVQEELYGNPLKKVEGLTFTIGGRNIEGQYFPIVYNPKVNASVSDNQVEDIAKTMVSSNAVWGSGMSATKSRLDVVKDKSLLLDFDVIPNAITEAINHVTMRKAVTDVNKLISNRELQNYIVDKFGADTYQFLRTWVRDNWQDEAAKTNDIDRLILTLKKNTSTAVMAGRVSVALQNALNLPVAFYRIGVGNTIRAINHAGIGFYGHGTTTYNNTRDFVLAQSIFMRERIQTLDKDLKQGLSIAGKGLRLGDTNVGGYKVEQLANVRDDINQMGFRLLTETDFALSIPVWKFAYDQKQAELMSKEGVSAEWIEQQSIEAGDRAVRDIFGSGDTKDAAAIQRSRSTFTQLFVPFYSYANTLYNIITEGNYARKDNGDYARFVKMLWWTLISQAVGMMAYKALTNGDDDKPEDLAKSFIEELVSQGTMGVPIIRDMSNMAMKYILGDRPFNKGNSVMALSIVEKFYDVGNAIINDKKDGIDLGRSLSQLANRATGFSDTVTDGLWTLAKYAFTDTDAAIEDVIMAIVFDRRLKTKKDKKKH
jgi:hypothetical protein